MRVLHVIPSVGSARGGPSFVIRTMAQFQSAQGLEVHVASTDDNGPEERIVPQSIPYSQDGVTYWLFPRQTRFYQFSWPLTAWLKAHILEFDVVHIHAMFSYSSIAAASCCWRAGVPYIVRPLGTLSKWGMRNRRPWLKQLSFALIEKRILKHAALVHYTSEQEAAEAQFLISGEPSLIVPNPVDLAPKRSAGGLRAAYPQLAGRTIVLFLSRLDQKKGLDLLLPAFAKARVSNPQAALVIAGDGDPEFVRGLHEQACTLGIEHEVIWAGFLRGDAKSNALADADIFALPSYSENFGVAVVEAMGAGIPVVVTDQVGIHQAVREENAGFVAGCSVSEVESALSRLLNDPQLRSEMGRNGALLARRFTPENVTNLVIEAYGTLSTHCNAPVAV